MKDKVNASTLMLRVAESLGRQRMFLETFGTTERGYGLFLHELNTQKELCKTMMEVADTKKDKVWAKVFIDHCDDMIKKFHGTTDPVDETIEKTWDAWRKKNG